MPITIVVADDHPLILDGLVSLFDREEGLKVVASCRDGEETLRAARQHRPDILILDLRMPVKDGLEVLRELSKEKLPTRVVILTAGLNEDDVLEAARLGARGVVLKEMAPQFLVQAVRKVAAGDQWLEKRSFGKALEKMLRREAGARQVAGVLTPREIEIVRMVASGLRNQVIADKLHISEGTVKVHLHNIYEKLQVDGRVALTLYARDKGLV